MRLFLTPPLQALPVVTAIAGITRLVDAQWPVNKTRSADAGVFDTTTSSSALAIYYIYIYT